MRPSSASVSPTGPPYSRTGASSPPGAIWKDGGSGEISSGNNRPLYWITLASDGPLPELAVGIFEQPIDDSETVNALARRCGERQQAEAAARTQADELRTNRCQVARRGKRAQGKLAGLAERSRPNDNSSINSRRRSPNGRHDRGARRDGRRRKRRSSSTEASAEELRAPAFVSPDQPTGRCEARAPEPPKDRPRRQALARICLPASGTSKNRREPPPQRPRRPQSPRQSKCPGSTCLLLEGLPRCRRGGVRPPRALSPVRRSEGRLTRAPRAPTDDEQLLSSTCPLRHATISRWSRSSFRRTTTPSSWRIVSLDLLADIFGPGRGSPADDASTDRSLEILRKFAERYPARTTVLPTSRTPARRFGMA